MLTYADQEKLEMLEDDGHWYRVCVKEVADSSCSVRSSGRGYDIGISPFNWKEVAWWKCSWWEDYISPDRELPVVKQFLEELKFNKTTR